MKYIIREMEQTEYGWLEEFLYEAVFVPEGMAMPPREIVRQPELQLYIENFGQKQGDLAVLAEAKGRIVGAAWTRLMKDYGYVDDHTPSLAIALYPGYRSRGIGRLLLTELKRLVKEAGYKRISLSVQKENFAKNLYLKSGFSVYKEMEEEYIMICDL